MPIEIEHLDYIYGAGTPFAKHALCDVNLSIADGEFWGIIGHTGSGKSTLCAHLNALTAIQSGTIRIDEFTLTGRGVGKKPCRAERKTYKKLRARVGMVFQYPEYQLFADTVEEDVAFGARNIGVPKEEIPARVAGALEMVGLSYETMRSRSPFDLSGGQKRRVALAGVLAMHPKVLVLDEPTAGLDPRGKREILELITRIHADMCPTVLMISHNMDEVATYCDKIAVMADGECKCVSTPAELFTREDLLRSLRIEMPSVTALACALSGAGLDIDRGILTEDALVQAILRAKGVEA